MSTVSGKQGAVSRVWRLFLVYALTSLVPVLVLGAVLTQDYRAEAVEQGLEQGRAQASMIEHMAIAPVLEGVDVGAGLTVAQVTRLHAATDLAVFDGSLVGICLLTAAGQPMFCNGQSAAGGTGSSDRGFRTAAGGHSAAAIVLDRQRPSREVVRVLQPLISGVSGRQLGVLALYLPYEDIAAHLTGQLRKAYRRIAAVLVALYVLLAAIAWSTTLSLQRYAARQEHAATHDSLTGLANRAAFRTRAATMLEVSRRTGMGGAVVLVDLDRFKEVNDTLGHHAGDELLQVVAERLQQCLRTDDMVARLGGDEFGLILHAIGRDDAFTLVGTVRDAVSQEIEIEGTRLGIEASFGVALYPEHGQDVEDLLRNADAAMYRGKRGTSDIVLYSDEEALHPAHWLVTQTQLRHALERDELVLYYQPKIRLSDGGICGLEALVRWQHPERGLLPPSEFLPAAEHSGLIEPLTKWVLRRALADHARWNAAGLRCPVAVNVSARNIETPGFADMVSQMLEEQGVPPDSLVLEVTETAMASDAVSAVRSIRQLSARGIAVAVDDFGIGYTSVSQLRVLPVSEVKIDQSFVTDVIHNPQSQAVVRSFIELAHGLGCKVTAEGVETPEVRDWLAQVGCDDAQGYLFARPMPWPAVVDFAGSLAAAGAARDKGSD